MNLLLADLQREAAATGFPAEMLIIADSRQVGSHQATQVPMLDVHELAAGKLAALVSRTASRDVFDTRELLGHHALDRTKLRLGFVVYGGANRKDWRSVSVDRALRHAPAPVRAARHRSAGRMSAKERRGSVDQLASIPDSAERLVLATGRYIGEGFDDARLDTLFLAMPISQKPSVPPLATIRSRLVRLGLATKHSLRPEHLHHN